MPNIDANITLSKDISLGRISLPKKITISIKKISHNKKEKIAISFKRNGRDTERYILKRDFIEVLQELKRYKYISYITKSA